MNVYFPTNPLCVAELDGNPTTYPYKIIVPNSCLTDNGDGTVTISLATILAAYLKLDQTTPETVTNGAPTFNGGATDAIKITAGKRLVFDA